MTTTKYRALGLLAAISLAAACGDDDFNSTHDLTVATNDLSVATVGDLAGASGDLAGATGDLSGTVSDSGGAIGDLPPATKGDMGLPAMPDMTAPPTVLRALLAGGQEVPPVDTTAAGSATVTLDAAKTRIDLHLEVPGLSNITAAHFHLAGPGVSGSIVLPIASASFTSPLNKTLTAADFSASNGLTTFADLVDAIAAGKTYINVHTAANPGGELRGHVGPTTIAVVLSGGQEVPATTSMGRGTATVKLNGSQDQLDVGLDVGALADITAAHFHAAPSGRNGPIILPLASASFTSPLTKTLTSADLLPGGGITTFDDAVRGLLSGGLYINVHTTLNPGGELRGQAGPTTVRATELSGTQEPGAFATSGSGDAIVTVSGDQATLSVVVDQTGLSNVTSAHIHVGAAGLNGPIILPLATASFTSPLKKTLTAASLTPAAGSGVNTFADAVDALLSGKTYVNVHTASNPGGEIRGQLGKVTLGAMLSGGSEVPAVASTAMGTALATIDGLQSAVDVTVTYAGLTDITASHIHVGANIEAGPVILGLASASFASPLKKTLGPADLTSQAGKGINTFADAINALISKRTYVNIHTVANPGGELRGQLQDP